MELSSCKDTVPMPGEGGGGLIGNYVNVIYSDQNVHVMQIDWQQTFTVKIFELRVLNRKSGHTILSIKC